MRLSQIKGDRVFDVIAEIIDPIANIAQDNDAMALFKREKVPEGMDSTQFFISRMKKAVPALLKSHKKDVVTILATINGVSNEEYLKNVTMASLIKDLFEMITDEELLSFLSQNITLEE